MGKKRIAQKGGVEREVLKEVPVSAPSREMREGRIYVFSSYNNTIMSLTDASGNVVAQVSAGAIGFKGTKKSTPFAASKVADALFQLAQQKGIGKVEIFVKGVGAGRDSALRSFGAKDIEIKAIRDVTPIPHNGPQPPKVRRV
ncbi:MAG: 30S ribosomal protein S11 [Candidatus Wildermuthbacteria bacterium]|nr:30S ribosomal protein S11 [Candidatus Wildermuthbacteria bacterium]